MFSCTVFESTKDERTQRTVVFQGNATFDRCDEVQRTLCGVMPGCSHLTIDLRGLMEIDLSFLVNICATHRSAEILGIGFSVKGSLSDCFIHDEEHATHSRGRGCPFSGRSECRFWGRPPQPAENSRTTRTRAMGAVSALVH